MGFSCSLHTGQEKLIKIDSTHVSCTIETVNLNIQYDVAIIDEIQMIGNEDRGNAWTQAFLGLDAKEIHICGDSRALDYISQLAKLTNDTVFCLFILLILQIEEVQYQRMGEQYLNMNLFQLDRDLRVGDCIICFQVKTIHQLKKIIQTKIEDKSVAIVYGKQLHYFFIIR